MNSQKLQKKSYYFYSDYLKAKYSNIEFDYIICWGFNAIELLTSSRDIFPNAKRVLLEGSKKIVKKELLLESDLIIKSIPDYSSTMEEIFRIKEIKKIIVMGTSDKLGQNRVNILKKIISNFEKNIDVEYLLDKNINEITKKLRIPDDYTIAFYLLMHSDGFGKKMTPYEVSEIICRDSNIPVFSFWDPLFESGIVGGDLINFEVIGEKTGKLIFSEDNKNYKEISPMKTVYDYNSLKKWEIDEDKIPPSATIVNKPPDFFVRYKMQIFIFILTVIFIVIITFLIYRQYLMRKTNKKCLELYEEIQKKNQQLNIISELDPLTGLKNRRAIDKIIKNELDRNSRYGNFMSILLIDVDHFKKINDIYGHNIGDKVLSEISKLLKENVRSTDSISRWGGEEFLIVAANTNLQETMKFSEKIRKKIEEFDFTKAEKITVSIGIAEYRTGETFNKLYERADKALYSAKGKGRNRIEF
ncbi:MULTISPECIES: GGDEF domain-containing protein [Psychrilyobacter]|nr:MULTISPECIES: GGDEF domain-containing protein [Psychrilyobacter]